MYGTKEALKGLRNLLFFCVKGNGNNQFATGYLYTRESPVKKLGLANERMKRVVRCEVGGVILPL